MYTLRKYIIVYMCDDTLKFVEAYCIAMQITQNGRLKYTFFFIPLFKEVVPKSIHKY